jgi:Tol biopolymer transport system component
MSERDPLVVILEGLDRPVTPRPEFAQALRARLLAELAEQNGFRARRHVPRPRLTLPRLGRGRQRRLRLAIVLAALILLLVGVACTTYFLVRGNGKLALGGLIVNPKGPGVRTIAGCPAGGSSCAVFESAWSPDGKRLAFVRGDLGGVRTLGRLSLYVAAISGGGVRRLASCGDCGYQYSGHLAWSPDGKWIAFSRREAGYRIARESLSLVPAAGGRPHRLTDCRPSSCADVEPAWSPDGHLLAFRRLGNARGAPDRLYTVRRDGSGLTSIAEGADPDWSPDSRSIAFDTLDGIDVANADGSDVRLLFAESGATGPGAPSWSPDGRKLVFFKTPGLPGHYRAEVWTMNADGSGKRRLYHSDCCVNFWAPPIWSPDGRMIAFSADSAGGTFVMKADGSGLRRVSTSTSTRLSWQERRGR